MVKETWFWVLFSVLNLGFLWDKVWIEKGSAADKEEITKREARIKPAEEAEASSKKLIADLEAIK
jgi:hypothetical protein